MASGRLGLSTLLRLASSDSPTQASANNQQLNSNSRPVLSVWRNAALTALALLLTIVVHVVAFGHHITDFITIGRRFAAPLDITNLATSPLGYDGQFFYYMAAFPGRLPPGTIDEPALRYSRMLYPTLIRLFSFGNVAWMPWVMLGINILAITATVLVIGHVVTERGGRPWLALVAGLYAGQPLAMLRDLSDPLAIFWLSLAFLGLARRRWLLTGAALGLGMLTRESTLLFVVCFALPLCLERRWRLLAAYVTVSLGGYAVWEGIIRLCLGTWGWRETTHVNVFLPVPFMGLASAPTIAFGVQMFVVACVPAVVAIAGGALLLRRRPWQDALALCVAVAAIGYGIAVLLQPGIHWLDIWEPYRLAAPLALLLPLLFSLLKPKRAQRTVGTLVLGMMVYSFVIALAG